MAQKFAVVCQKCGTAFPATVGKLKAKCLICGTVHVAVQEGNVIKFLPLAESQHVTPPTTETTPSDSISVSLE